MPTEHDRSIDPARPGKPADPASRLGLKRQRRRPLITAMEIKNFKGIGRPVRIDLRPITLLFGRNSAGKSTILHAICYAQEILSQRSVDAGKTTLGGDQVDLGGFRRFVHEQDTDRHVHLAFELDLEGRSLSSQLHTDDLQYLPIEKDELDQAADAVTSGWLKLRIGWDQRLKTPRVESYAVGVDNDCVGSIEAAVETGRPSLARFLPNLQHPVFIRAGFSEGATVLTPGGWDLPQVSALPAWGETLPIFRRSNLNDSEREDVNELEREGEFNYFASVLMVGVGRLLKDELAAFRYIGPMRDVRPPLDDDSMAEQGMPAAVREALGRPPLPHPTGRAHWSNGSKAWDVLRKGGAGAVGSDLIGDVDDWMSRDDRLDTGYHIERQTIVELSADHPSVSSIRHGVPREDIDMSALIRAVAEADTRSTVRLKEVESELVMETTSVGVGISQVLPIVVAALDPARPGITGIEQPELHVHPKIQVELGDLFAQGVDDGGVFLIETHSEHLMLRLLRRIEETHSGELPQGKPALRPDQVSVVFVERVDGEVQATPLRIDETGEFIDRWPHGFFDERSDELF